MAHAMFSAIGDALVRDKPVANAGFGKFALRSRAARLRRNPHAAEPVAFPASKAPLFKLAKALRTPADARAYLRNACLQNLRSGTTSAPYAVSVTGHRAAAHPHSAGYTEQWQPHLSEAFHDHSRNVYHAKMTWSIMSTTPNRRNMGNLLVPTPSMIFACTFLMLVISGCVATSGFPERPEPINEKLVSLQGKYFLPSKDVLAEYDQMEESGKRSYRDKVIHGRLLALDMQYGSFKQAIYEEGVSANLTIDTLGVVIGAAGAAVTGSDGSRVLSALSGGISGTGTAINKNLYYERTLPALLALMDAKRDEIRAEILAGMTLDHIAYPLGRALTDLERYLQAGSIPGAISEVLTTAGETKANAEAQISIVRADAFVNAKAQERIDSLLDLVDQLPENGALQILTNPPSEIDADTLAAVQARLRGLELSQALTSILQNDDMKAKEILKMILVLLANRDEENAAVWSAAMVALSEGE